MSLVRFVGGPIDGELREYPDPLPRRIHVAVCEPARYTRGDVTNLPDYLPYREVAYEQGTLRGEAPGRAYRFTV